MRPVTNLVVFHGSDFENGRRTFLLPFLPSSVQLVQPGVEPKKKFPKPFRWWEFSASIMHSQSSRELRVPSGSECKPNRICQRRHSPRVPASHVLLTGHQHTSLNDLGLCLPDWIASSQRASVVDLGWKQNITQEYCFTSSLGSGSFGKVRIATRKTG
jgi:hypothetical protein